jgi:hypothetical protein
VLKKKLSLVEPTIRTDGGFEYEEGEGLDEDEVAANAARLPVALNALPGGGLRHGAIAYVEDQVQEFHVQIEILHKVAAAWHSRKSTDCVALPYCWHSSKK